MSHNPGEKMYLKAKEDATDFQMPLPEGGSSRRSGSGPTPGRAERVEGVQMTHRGERHRAARVW